jgi:hypothetical protein
LLAALLLLLTTTSAGQAAAAAVPHAGRIHPVHHKHRGLHLHREQFSAFISFGCLNLRHPHSQVFFIYSILGVYFFGKVKPRSLLSDFDCSSQCTFCTATVDWMRSPTFPIFQWPSTASSESLPETGDRATSPEYSHLLRFAVVRFAAGLTSRTVAPSRLPIVKKSWVSCTNRLLVMR